MNHQHQHILRCFTIVQMGRWHYLEAFFFAFNRGCFHFSKIYCKILLSFFQILGRLGVIGLSVSTRKGTAVEDSSCVWGNALKRRAVRNSPTNIGQTFVQESLSTFISVRRSNAAMMVSFPKCMIQSTPYLRCSYKLKYNSFIQSLSFWHLARNSPLIFTPNWPQCLF